MQPRSDDVTSTEPDQGGTPTPAELWERRYQEADAVWSGRPNAALVTEATGLPAGRALDLGCGEGADSVWLAEHGWQVTAIDISATAIARGRAHAEARGVDDRIEWHQHDLVTWQPAAEYDLVSAQFLHSRFDFPRDEVLRRAAAAAAPGGAILVVGHAGVPPWAQREADADQRHEGSHREGGHHHEHENLPTAAETVRSLGLDQPGWAVLVAEHRTRTATLPDGSTAELDDAVVLARRSTTS